MERTITSFSDRELEVRIAYFSRFITPERSASIRRVLDYRTRHVTVVLENIYQAHNAAAVLRSCDAFGIQDAHIIENSNRFSLSPKVDMGASRWLTLHRYRTATENTLPALERLKSAGYRIAATSPHVNDVELEKFVVGSEKTAFLFGTELEGLSREAMEAADLFVRIPMFGFVESFNLSVCCALTIHHIVSSLHRSKISWQLSPRERLELHLSWLQGEVRNPHLHEERIRSFAAGIDHQDHENQT